MPTSNAASAPHQHAALLGRGQPLAILRDALVAGRPCMVRGEAGIGKTVLVQEAMASVERPVVAGRGIRVLRDVPYLPLRHAVLDLPTVGEPADVVAVVRPRRTGAIVMIDDLQWCDLTTRCSRSSVSRCRWSLRCAQSLPRQARLIERLAEVGVVIELGPLDDDAARLLVEDRSPGVPTSDVDRWVAGASGNPLMLELAASIRIEHDGYTVWCRGAQHGRKSRRRVDRRTAARLALAAGCATSTINGTCSWLISSSTCLPDGRVELRHDLVAEAALRLIGTDRRRALHLELAWTATDAASRGARHLAGRGTGATGSSKPQWRPPGTPRRYGHGRNISFLAAQHVQVGEQLGVHVDAAEQLSLAGEYHDVVSVLEGVDLDGGPGTWRSGAGVGSLTQSTRPRWRRRARSSRQHYA